MHIISILESYIYFFNINIVIQECVLLKEQHTILSSNFGNFPMERNSAWGPWNEISFFCQICGIFFEENMGYVVIDMTGVFPSFQDGLKIFAFSESPFKHFNYPKLESVRFSDRNQTTAYRIQPYFWGNFQINHTLTLFCNVNKLDLGPILSS